MPGDSDCFYSKLTDFDWSVRLALSSDKVSGLKRGKLLLKLSFERTDGTIDDSHIVELDPTELANFLQRLKEAQTAVQNLRK